ncbi:MAG TPA: hypothetical protein VKE51_35305 [Vicinamibacterales bacterium]|nr:hypothetical protein [Vicinamibacterales bacterium]
MGKLVAFVSSGVLAFAGSGFAQEARAWTHSVFVTIDVSFQPLNNDFSESVSFPDSLRRSENVTFVAGYESTKGALFAAGAGVRLVKNVGAGMTTSWFQRSASASFDLRVPSPLAVNRPLALAGSVPDLRRQEVGIHVQGLYAIPIADRIRAIVGAGPSVFRIQQDLVRSVEFDTLPGFTSLAFDQAFTTRVERTVVGFNVGADVTWAFASHFGVGSIVRYSRASATLDPGAETGVSRAIEMRAGGLQIGAGVRLLF